MYLYKCCKGLNILILIRASHPIVSFIGLPNIVFLSYCGHSLSKYNHKSAYVSLQTVANLDVVSFGAQDVM